MININMSKEQLDLLSDHLLGNKTLESEILIYNLLDQANEVLEDREDLNNNINL
jgi:hypothetical protein